MKNQTLNRGFSLIETLVAAGVFSIMILGVGTAFLTVSKRYQKVSEVAGLDISRNEAQQLLSSRRIIREALVANVDAALLKCFSGGGSQCLKRGENAATLDLSKSGFVTSQSTTCAGGKCTISRDVKYQWACSSDKLCDGAKIDLKVNYTKNGKDKNVYGSTVFYRSHDFLTLPAMNYKSCENKVVKGIDYSTGQVVCDGLGKIDCGGYSIVGVNSGDCGAPPALSSTYICNIQFTGGYSASGSEAGATLNYTVAGPSAGNLSVQCSVDANGAQIAGGISNYFYDRKVSSTMEESIFVPGLQAGYRYIDCRGYVRDDSGKVMAACSAFLDVSPPPPPPLADSSAVSVVDDTSSSSSSSSSSSASSGSSTGATAGGSGAEVSTTVSMQGGS